MNTYTSSISRSFTKSGDSGMVEPIYEKPQVDLIHRSKTTNIWIGVSLTFAFLVVGVVIYCYVTGRRRRRQQQQQQLQQQHAIHFIEMTAALPRTIYHPAGDMEEDRLECSLCLEEYQDGEELVELPGCGHLYHQACIEDALRGRRECPFCRAGLEGLGVLG